MSIFHLYPTLFIILLASCSGSNHNEANNINIPKTKFTKDPSSGFNQVELAHSQQSGALKWSLRVKDKSESQVQGSQAQDICEFAIEQVGSEAQVYFKDQVTTPFCSSFSIDPISTIDNIIISTSSEELEVCLNDICREVK